MYRFHAFSIYSFLKQTLCIYTRTALPNYCHLFISSYTYLLMSRVNASKSVSRPAHGKAREARVVLVLVHKMEL